MGALRFPTEPAVEAGRQGVDAQGREAGEALPGRRADPLIDQALAAQGTDEHVDEAQEEQGHGDLVDAVHDPEVDAFALTLAEEVQWVGVVEELLEDFHGVEIGTVSGRWGSIAGDGADLHPGLLGQSGHEDGFPGRQGVRESRPVGGIHFRIVPGIDEENSGLHDAIESGIRIGQDGGEIVNGPVDFFGDGALHQCPGFGNEGNLPAAEDGVAMAPEGTVARDGFGHGASIGRFDEHLQHEGTTHSVGGQPGLLHMESGP